MQLGAAPESADPGVCPQSVGAGPGLGTLDEYPAAYVWRSECRGVLVSRWEAAGVSINARWGPVRPDLPHEWGRFRRADGFHGARADHLRLLPTRRQAHPLLLDAPGWRGLPSLGGP